MSVAPPGSGSALYRTWWTPLLWTAPTLLVTAVFGVFPFLNTIVLSFTDAQPLGGGGSWVGLANYERLLTDGDFWTAAGNSVLYAIVAVPLLVVLSLILAQLVVKRLPGIGFFRTAYYTPVIASMVALALVWQSLLSERGPINTFLGQIGLIASPIPFLSDSTLLLFSAIALTVWKGLGWYMIFYLAALANVPRELYEAAELDGAGAVRRFVSITVPSVRLTVLLVAIMSGTGSLRIFTEIYVLGGSTGGPGGGARTLPFYIRDVALDPVTGNTGYGSAVSIALFVMTIGLAVAAHKLSSAKGDEE
ncbi:ABC transporter permease [Leifsonia xyli subsp. xyli]|uniref:ABC transporter, permease protein n=2 Tax=Leifsonia xyli subsp. xyli TaxID=59736 RepID=Q6ACA0_LEIXX|nr:sugar ABC transporter permease [Leifsonia xyli]AAT89993.1 ABC transporter, permease protein [Leifsonia xyli subsp. xyli str. CTCB07]ODA90026.1 ABC transporter permease [Leifsonia xyli subsp. xyli]